ncbi:MAG: hypothetical protein GX600_05950 [Dehalococcoidia bacterium]|nr:hypothetical protein [Dehalococcoidia bacterium]
MAKLNLAHGGWLFSRMTALGVPRDCMAPRFASAPLADGSLGMLGREVCALPELFSGARRLEVEGGDGCAGSPETGAAAPADAVHAERRRREGLLAPVAERLLMCRTALEACASCLAPAQRRRIDDALRTLETEYVRLRDAERFFFDRRLRQIQTGEADDDPEFTIILERVLYAVDQGDDVTASVATAVQTIAAVLVDAIREQQRTVD